jgi:hypothetical protein
MSSSSHRGSAFAFMVFTGICLFGSCSKSSSKIPSVPEIKSIEHARQLLELYYGPDILQLSERDRHYVLKILDQVIYKYVTLSKDRETGVDAAREFREALGCQDDHFTPGEDGVVQVHVAAGRGPGSPV